MKNAQLIILVCIHFVAGLGHSQAQEVATNNLRIFAIAFTPGGSALLVGDGPVIKLYSTADAKLMAEFKGGHSQDIMALDVSLDSTLVVSAGKDSALVVWDFPNRKVLRILRGHKGVITALKLSPDGRFLFSGATDHKTILHEVATGNIIREYTDHTDDVLAVDFSRDARLMASSGADRSLRIYDAVGGKLIKTINRESWIRTLAFSPDSKKLVFADDKANANTLDVSKSDSIREVASRRLSINWVLSVAVNSDNKTIATGSANGRIEVITPFGVSKESMHVPVTRVLFRPNTGKDLKIAVATLGRGIVLIDTKNVKLRDL